MSGAEKKTGRPLPKKWFFAAGAILGLLLVTVTWMNHGKESTDDAFIEAHIVQISPEISERVLKVCVDDNQMIQKGDLLVELDPRNNQALYAQAEANLATSQAKLVQAQAQLTTAEADLAQSQSDVIEAQANADNAAKELTRSTELRVRGVIAQREFDNAQAEKLSSQAGLLGKQKKVLGSTSDIKVAEAAVTAAEAQVKQGEALLETARLRLSFTKIYAPESGLVTRKNVEPGNYVQTGNALMAIVPDEYWVIANYKETQLSHMRPGQSVDIKLDAYPWLKLHGHVDSIQAGTGSRFSLLPAENATGNFVKVVQRVPVKIVLDALPKDTPQLAPGMSAVPTVYVQ